MTSYIHNNFKILNDFQLLLNNNNKNDIVNFYNEYHDLIIIDQIIFNHSCQYCDLEIVQFIYNILINKNINIIDALYANSNQYNIKVFKWLLKKYNLNKKEIFQCLNYCILNNNPKLFKFIYHKFNINLSNYNFKLLKMSIHKSNIIITKDIIKHLNLTFDEYDFNYFKYACYSNNYQMISFINNTYDFLNIIGEQNNILNFLFELFKKGYLTSIKYLLKNYFISFLVEKNINECIEYSFISGNIKLIKYIMDLDYHSIIDYQHLYNKIITLDNIEIIDYLYHLNINIHLLNLTSFTSLIENNQFKMLSYCLKKESNYYFQPTLLPKYTEIIHLYFFKIINFLEVEYIKLFFHFIKNNNIEINNEIYILNYLIMYNQFDKIIFLNENYSSYLNYNPLYLFYDSLQSNNIKCIHFALSKLNINIELDINKKYKNKLIEHAYVYGILNIINLYDENNNAKLNNIDKILITNIIKNNLIIIELILKKITNNISKIENINSIIHYIFKVGNFQVLQIFLNYLPDTNLKDINYFITLLSDNNYFFFYNIIKIIDSFDFINESFLINICRTGNLKIMNWFFNLDIKLSELTLNNSFEYLIRYNHYEQGIYLYNKFKNKFNLNIFQNNYKSLTYCFNENNFTMIKWFFKQFSQVEKIKFLVYFEYYDYMYYLIKNDNEIILKYIIDFYKIQNSTIIFKFASFCLQQKKYNCLNYLITHFDISNELTTINFKHYFDNGADDLNYDIINIIVKNIKDFDWLLYSAKKNYYFIFLYLLKNLKNHLKLSEDTFFNLSYLDDINYIKIFTNYYKNIDYNKINAVNLSVIISYNNLEMLKYLYDLNPNIDFNQNDCYILRLSVSCKFDSISYWLLNNIKNLNVHVLDNVIYKTCVMNSNLDLLKCLYQYCNIIDFSEYEQFYLKMSIYSESPEMFKWIYSILKHKSPEKLEYKLYIKNIVYHDNLTLLDFIISEYNDFDINFDNGYIIRICFGNNFNDIIKYLFQHFNHIDVLIENEIIMKYAVEDADLEMIELLYHYNSNFNLSIDDEYLFKTACKTNNLNIAKWLISKKNDIHYAVNNHEIFYFVCEQEYINICQYLCELDSSYQINIEDNRIISYNVTKILNINYDIKKKVTSIDNCPICFEISELITPCEHQFCKSCLKSINNKNHDFSCPLCRNTINELYQVIKDD